MKDFAAIDFETANAAPTSVCSVGIVMVRDCRVVDTFYSLIKPEPEEYNYWCSQVHGLREEDTRQAPRFPEVWAQVADRLEGLPLVAHNKAFDENCLKAVFGCYGMDYPDYEFRCTLLKSRRVWPTGRHSLDVIAERCGYDLRNHHNALADAEACAAIAIRLFNPDGDPYFMEPADRVLELLMNADEPLSRVDLAQELGLETNVVSNALYRLKNEGKVGSPKRGLWEAAGEMT